jgi:hypothetical protein
VNVGVSHRADFFQVLGISIYRGRSAEIFNLYFYFFYFNSHNLPVQGGSGRHSAKNFSKKKSTRQRIFPKKIKLNLYRVSATSALGKEAVNVTVAVFIAECPIFGTWQRNLCRLNPCRVRFAECHTRQSLWRVDFGLCRVWPTLSKVAESCSDRRVSWPPSSSTEKLALGF